MTFCRTSVGNVGYDDRPFEAFVHYIDALIDVDKLQANTSSTKLD